MSEPTQEQIKEFKDVKVKLEWKLQDMWIGIFWKPRHLWICILPMLPIHIEKREWGHYYGEPYRGYACEEHLYPSFQCPNCKRIGR